MNKTMITAVTTGLLFGAVSCGSNTKSQQEEATPSPAGVLMNKLAKTVEDKKVMFGHHDDTVYGTTWTGEGTSDMAAVTGRYPAVMSWDLGSLELDSARNLDGVPFDSIRSKALAQDARGGINTFSWHLHHALSGADSWNTSDSLAVSKLVNTPEGQTAYKKQLEKVADFLMSLKDKDGNRIGVIFRPWHEHTGGWFWWGASNCSVEDYKALWSIMRDEFDKKGVDNVVWAYSPDNSTDESMYMERYPGDEYVDICGADVYHFNGKDGIDAYKESAERTLGIACRMAEKHGKIAAFTETGLESLPIADWFTADLLPVLRKFPVAYAVVWRNAMDKPGHFYVPYPGHPACGDFNKFVADPMIVTIKANN